MSLIFDTHAHYDDHSFDKDREELLSGLLKQGVGNVVNASAALRDIPFILEMTKRYDFMFASSGLHPSETYACEGNKGKPVIRYGCGLGSDHKKLHEALWPLEDMIIELSKETITDDWKAGERELSIVRAMAKAEKVVAVGEIGLDYHYDDTRKDVQKKWFEDQLRLSQELHLPVIIHSRDAAEDTFEILKAVHGGSEGGIIHCFSYGKEMAARFMDMGYMIGVGGVITFSNAKKLKEVVRYMPLDMMVLETDCPYLAPLPFRGKRNDSALIKYVADEIAAVRGISSDEVIMKTSANAKRVYRIS